MAGTDPRAGGDDAERRRFVIVYALGSMFAGAIIGCFLALVLRPFIYSERGKALGTQFGLSLPPPADLLWWSAAAGAVLGIVFGAISGVFGHAGEVRRRADFRRIAASLGGQFSVSSDEALADKLQRVIGEASFVDMSNVVRARLNGIALTVGDLNLSTGTVEGGRNAWQTAAFYESDTLRFPQFLLQPEGVMMSMLMSASGIEDLDFPAHPQFSQAYHLWAEHAESTRRLFNSELLDALGRQPGLLIRSDSNSLVVYRQYKLCEPEELKTFMNEAAEIFRLFERAARKSGSQGA